MKSTIKAAVLAAAVALLAAGCAVSNGGPTKMYSGASKPANEVAVYKAGQGGGDWTVLLRSVDGKALNGFSQQAEVTPGPHQIVATPMNLREIAVEANRMKSQAGLPVSHPVVAGQPVPVVFGDPEADKAEAAQKARTTRTIGHTAAAGKTYQVTCDSNGQNLCFVEAGKANGTGPSH